MSKHFPSKKMKDKIQEKVEAQQEEENQEEDEEEALLEEVEEENRVLKINQHMHQEGYTPKEVEELKIREIYNVIVVKNLIILSMSVD